jgi:hypothetical protein
MRLLSGVHLTIMINEAEVYFDSLNRSLKYLLFTIKFIPHNHGTTGTNKKRLDLPFTRRTVCRKHTIRAHNPERADVI